MTVSDYQLMDAVLGEIRDVSQMAILHRESDIAAHEVDSDVDLCVADHPLEVMSIVAPRMADNEIFLILASYYDRCSYSFFFCDLQGQFGAQVDLLHDPKGVGRCGVRTNILLDGKCDGVRWPRIDHLDEALYVLRKRQMKRDIPRLLEARRVLREQGTELVTRRAAEIFSSRACSTVVRALADDRVFLPRTTGFWLSRAMRPSRLVRRYGFWAHLVGDRSASEAVDLSQRMNHMLISTEVAAKPALSSLLTHLLRPHLLVSAGKEGVWPRPDVILETGRGPGAADDLAARLVAAMHKRALRRLMRVPEGVEA